MSSPTNKSGRQEAGYRTNGNAGEKRGGSIDRESRCPLLLRVFCATSRHNGLSDYNKGTSCVANYITTILRNVLWLFPFNYDGLSISCIFLGNVISQVKFAFIDTSLKCESCRLLQQDDFFLY